MPADIAMALLRMVSYNIAHLAYLNAKRYNLRRVFFGGFFIRGSAYTMDTISYAIQFWSRVRVRVCRVSVPRACACVCVCLCVHDGHDQLCHPILEPGTSACRVCMCVCRVCEWLCVRVCVRVCVHAGHDLLRDPVLEPGALVRRAMGR